MNKITRKIRQIRNAHTTKKILKYLENNPDVTYSDVFFRTDYRGTILSDGKIFRLYYTEDYNR